MTLAEAPAGLLAVDHRPAQAARLVIGLEMRQVVAVAAAEAGVLLEQAFLYIEFEVPGLLIGVGAVDLLQRKTVDVAVAEQHLEQRLALVGPFGLQDFLLPHLLGGE